MQIVFLLVMSFAPRENVPSYSPHKYGLSDSADTVAAGLRLVERIVEFCDSLAASGEHR
jgi:hypothetical protein